VHTRHLALKGLNVLSTQKLKHQKKLAYREIYLDFSLNQCQAKIIIKYQESIINSISINA